MLRLEDLAELTEKHPQALTALVKPFAIGHRQFHWGSMRGIMGVINLSPDSWYRESVCLSIDRAVQRGRALHAQGADLIDLGAESTLAHAARVDSKGQQDKLIPIIESLRSERILVSIETYDFEVAQACLKSGANVLNLTGTANNESMFRLVADHDAAVILCYVQGKNVREVSDFDFGKDPIEAMREYFSREIERAGHLGVKSIVLDPGLGFYYRNLQDSALRVRYQMQTFLNTFRLRDLGYPVCHALPHAFEFFGEEVRVAEPFFAVLAALGKTDLFRTHEVARTKAVLDTLAIYEEPGKKPVSSQRV
jgi:dihydropteroate synthase